MGKLAELAKTSKLKGSVAVTFANGTTRTFATEADAEAGTSGLTLEHRRGAFFEQQKAAEKPAAATRKVATSEKVEKASAEKPTK
jgi:phosphomannomutase